MGPDLGLPSTSKFVVRRNGPLDRTERSPQLTVHLDDPLVKLPRPGEIFLRVQMHDGRRANNPTG